jgi:DegV family protein with EDD domain
MGGICIVTDSSAQFLRLFNPQLKNIVVVPFGGKLNGNKYDKVDEIGLDSLPSSADKTLAPSLTAPSVEYFKDLFFQLSQKYDALIGIFISSHLNSCYQNAHLAASTHQGKSVIIIDSQTISVGLGYLVQVAAETAASGANVTEIDRKIRSIIPYLFTVICTPGLSYLQSNGFVDLGQAVIGEMLGLYPIFALENGKLTSLEKVRSQRHAIVFFQEFLDEFEQMEHIAIIKNEQDAFENHLPSETPTGGRKTQTQEYPLSPSMALLFGPNTLGMVVIETPDHRNR